jgi:hypothetical protein
MVALMNMPALSGGASKKDISPRELSQRVAVIKRFKELLKAQRDRFRAYLDALDKQKDVIEKGSADDLLRHVEFEEKIVSDISSIQKVIDPLEEMYMSVRVEAPADSALEPGNQGVDEVSGLKEALEGLKAEAVVRSEQNRGLLAKRMAELRSEIKSLRSNAYARRGIDNTPTPTQIDIKG